jgi:hypothetical protein
LEAKEYGHKFTGFIKEAASEVELFWMEKREPGGLWLSYEHEAQKILKV